MIFKFNYDRRHILINLTKSFKTYLRLHHNYIILDIFNKKLSQQRVDFLIILNKINILTYRLNLSSMMTIHFVVFVTQLKFLFVVSNSYLRSRFDDKNSSFITTKNDDDFASHYEIENLLNKRMSRDKIQYLVK